ncbi:MAG: Holliday junction branch migration protein RuvA [Candidatus Paceibacterota bacterium]|jgi:Holliday junction DNA helicase RuvA|nr:Holliday junction branch migration protein RuvA [bacterium]
MINFIFGEILYKDDKKIVLDRGGIGFEIFLSVSNLEKISIGEKRQIHTYLAVGEKIMELYGFLSEKESEFFRILKSISGVGPKTALNLATFGSPEKLKESLERGDNTPETKGLGSKKLQKILLELTGRIEEINKKEKNSGKGDEVFEALLGLGFSKKEIIEALSQLPVTMKQTEQRIKEALKILGK